MYSLLDVDYYVNSLLLLKKELEKRDENFKNYTILYFYDIQDKEIISGHINFLKDVFDIPFTDINNLNLTDWQQLLLMSNCTHHVIANSTFSWWGAYLNDNNSKIVTYPEVWLDNNSINKDLIPSQWNIINIKINVINIFYINLKHRLDRKTSIETQLKNLKSFVQSFLFSCTRLEAIYNNNGAIGCGQSHILALQKADLMKLPYILIMEDDLILKKETI